MLDLFYDEEHYISSLHEDLEKDEDINHEPKDLEQLIKDRKMKSLRKFLFNSVVLADFLIRSNKNHADLDREFLSYVILVHLMQYKYNNIKLQDFVFDANSNHSGYEGYGDGFYTSIAMSNHSCSPNIAPIYQGSKCFMITIRNVYKRTQLFNCYEPLYTLKDKKDRRQDLQRKYGFNCFCEACRNNYPQVDRGSHNLRYLKCPRCFAAKGCQEKCSNCDHTIDIDRALSGIAEGLQMKKKIMQYIILKDYHAAIKQAQLACLKLETVLGIPDYEVATCYHSFSQAFEFFIKNGQVKFKT